MLASNINQVGYIENLLKLPRYSSFMQQFTLIFEAIIPYTVALNLLQVY